MISAMFTFGTDTILVVVKGNEVTFGNTSFGAVMSSIDGLKLSREGAIKEFPDLKDNPNWRNEAIKRFKEKIALLDKEKEILEYVITDLKKYGYVPKYKQVQGFRKEAIH